MGEFFSNIFEFCLMMFFMVGLSFLGIYVILAEIIKPIGRMWERDKVSTARKGLDSKLQIFRPLHQHQQHLTDEVLLDILSLVMFEKIPDINEIGEWLEKDKDLVLDWAGAVHAHASDNDDVEIPEKPLVLEGYN